MEKKMRFVLFFLFIFVLLILLLLNSSFVKKPDNLIGVIINDNLYPFVREEIEQFVDDLENEGWRVFLKRVKNCQPSDLRNFLADRLPDGLTGVILIGDLPIPWFEIKIKEYPDITSKFPCDLFYMDLNGRWFDQDENGIYDAHAGNTKPEIWLGRLTFSPMKAYGSEIDHLKFYLAKNHAWRKNWQNYRKKKRQALICEDYDWITNGQRLKPRLSVIYGKVDIISNYPNLREIKGQDYLNLLQQDYEFVTAWIHGNTGFHGFRPFNRQNYVFVRQIVESKPKSYFYNLYSCGSADYSSVLSQNLSADAEPYIGAAYLISGNGLVVIGGTKAKAGGMIYPAVFYDALSRGETFGKAFMEWWIKSSFSDEKDVRQWNYGVTILGDPTLKIKE